MVHPNVALDAAVVLALGGLAGGGVKVDAVARADFGGVAALDLFDGVLICDNESDFNEAVAVTDLRA